MALRSLSNHPALTTGKVLHPPGIKPGKDKSVSLIYIISDIRKLTWLPGEFFCFIDKSSLSASL